MGVQMGGNIGVLLGGESANANERSREMRGGMQRARNARKQIDVL